MDEPAHMPELRDDLPAGVMHGVGHLRPAPDLLFVPQTGRVRPAETFAADPGRFGNDEAGARALGVISGHKLVGHSLPTGPRPSQRRHHNSIGEIYRTDRERVEQGGHSKTFRCDGTPSFHALENRYSAKPFQPQFVLTAHKPDL